MALIVEIFSKRKKKQKILLAKEKITFFKKIQKNKSTFIFLTVLVSVNIEKELLKPTVLINRIELLNYKISGVFSYLVKQLQYFCSRKREQ
jgi:hypothetical protein